MPGDTGGDPRDNERVTSHRAYRKKQAERDVDTLSLDGASPIYGDGEPESVEKEATDASSPLPSLDTDGITAELRAQAEAARPDCLSPEALAKSVGERPERGLSHEAIKQSLHDDGLSTKEAVLEVRDELRNRGGDGGPPPADSTMSKDAGDEPDAATLSGSGIETDDRPDGSTVSAETDAEPPASRPRLADDDPVPETVDELVKRDPALAEALAIPVDGEGHIPDGQRGFARHRYALAKVKAREASA